MSLTDVVVTSFWPTTAGIAPYKPVVNFNHERIVLNEIYYSEKEAYDRAKAICNTMSTAAQLAMLELIAPEKKEEPKCPAETSEPQES